MRGELAATAGDRELLVSVEPCESKWKIRIDDREVVVDAIRIRPGTWSLLLGGRSILVDVDDSKPVCEYHTHQAKTAIRLESAQRKRLAEKMGQGAGTRKKGEDIVAPIAGRVVSIAVEVGDKVEAGQCVAILEAMKMENEIKCAREGVVEKVSAKAGDSVDTNAKLLRIAPLPDEK